MSTMQQSQVTTQVRDRDGSYRDLGVYDSFTPGDTTADTTKHRAGGMRGQKVYASLPDNDDLTLARVGENERDAELIRWLLTRVGRADMKASEQRLGVDGIPFGKPTVYVGKLTGLNVGEADSNSGDPRMYTLTMTVVDVA